MIIEGIAENSVPPNGSALTQMEFWATLKVQQGVVILLHPVA